ncbi:MAG: hypothetical protein H0V22_10605 [Solirubrobacterales bacterium]|nr:hypothetical protein [Solirubrobacterales bacterium]
MKSKSFTPGHVTVLVGERVEWVNDDSTVHDVAASGPALDSGRLRPGDRFSHTFTRQGPVPYRCTLHPFMRGTVDVFALALRAPLAPIRIGRTAGLSGRAPAGSGPITIEALSPDKTWRAVRAVTPGDGQTYRVDVTPERSTAYRARAGELSSAPARVIVSSRLSLTAVRHAGSAIAVTVGTQPAQPGARILIERYVRERFDWRPARRARLDARSRARLTLRSPRRERLRAVLPRGVRGYGAATSPVAVVRAARPGVVSAAP